MGSVPPSRAVQRTAVVTDAAVDGHTAAGAWVTPRAFVLLGVLLVAITSLVLAPSAGAAASNSVIKACYKTSTGALRLITGRGSCGHGEKPISWNVAGRAGARGPIGPAGFLGVPGFPGAPGARGAASTVRGVAGATGATGFAGVNGENGANGAAGANGARGAAGASGEAGKAGENGKNGAPGAAGATGATGHGSLGAEGPTGPAGAGGGVSGATGPTGATGTAGAPFPAALPTGDTEKGAWIITEWAKEPELPPKFMTTIISFPIPLANFLGKTQVHFIHKEKTLDLEKGGHELEPGVFEAVSEPGCYSPPLTTPLTEDKNLLEEPKAEDGNLCVYAGVETVTPEVADAPFTAIENTQRSTGASTNGALIVWEVLNGSVHPIKVRVQGTWAVTGA